jgi:hypothetical protein
MTTFYMLWILVGNGQSQTIAIDHFEAMAQCEAAGRRFIEEYNKTQSYSWQYLNGDAAKCFKVEVK